MAKTKVVQTKQNKKLFVKRHFKLVNLLNNAAHQKKVVPIEDVQKALDYSNRAARNNISEMSLYYAIISLTQEKGYEMLIDIDNYTEEELKLNIEKVQHQINDFQSRINVLKRRMKPLIAWKKVAEKKLKEE